MVETLVPADAGVDLVRDETPERRWGRTISTRGQSRERALSSRTREVEPSWPALDRDGSCRDPSLDETAMGVAVLGCPRHDSLRVSERLGKRHQTIGMWAPQMIHLVRRWLPGRPLKLMGETASLVLEWGLHAQAKPGDARHHRPMGCRARISSPPERTRHTIGRPRVVGLRLPALQPVFPDPETVWQKLRLDWSGQGERTRERCIGTALWDRSGSDPLPIRWVRTRDPLGKRPRHPPCFPPTPPRRQNRWSAIS